MKTRIALAASFFLLFAQHGFASGGSVTGDDGGHGVLCSGYFKNDGLIIHAHKLELLDFYEARTSYRAMRKVSGRPNLFVAGDWNTQKDVCVILKNKLRSLENVLQNQIEMKPAFEKACQLAWSAKWSGEIFPTDDHGDLRTPVKTSCQLVQLAKRNQDMVVVDDRWLPWLNISDLTGLFLHEALHPYFAGNSTTQAVRQLVMFAFAKSSFLQANKHLLRELIETRQPIEPARFIVN